MLKNIYLLKYPDGTVFYIGIGEPEEVLTEAKRKTARVSFTTNVIRYLWRNNQEPLIENIETENPDELFKELLDKHQSKKLTNKTKVGV